MLYGGADHEVMESNLVVNSKEESEGNYNGYKM